MKRHTIIAKLGPNDVVSPNKSPGRIITEIPFIKNKRLTFGLGDVLDQLNAHGSPAETAIDLLILAAMVQAADTRISRSADAQDGWTREIDLYLPVSDPQTWIPVSSSLCEMLRFLTGDIWRIQIRSRPRGFSVFAPQTVQRSSEQPSSLVCLFSGGLDSFAGVLDLLSAGQNPLLVSHSWETITRHHQVLCLNHLRKQFPSLRVSEVAARIGFPRDLIGESQTESTQRSRSFLFFALATLAASACGRDLIHVPENGFVSLNVPLDPSRLGAWSTRTTHPFFVAKWNELISSIGLAAKIVNPYQFKTKGEMLKECAAERKFLYNNLGDTMSCASPTKGRWAGEGPKHCGHCFPCLIRRAAIAAAFKSDPTDYTIRDLTLRPLHSTQAEGEHVRALQYAIRRVEQSPGIAHFLIHEPGPLSQDPKELAQYADLYTRAMRELSNFLAGARTRPE